MKEENSAKLLNGNEKFRLNGRELDFSVLKALRKGLPDNCNGWTVYDLNYRGKRIEVKATSYWQSWKKSHAISEQRTFSIRKTYVDYQNNKSEKERQNDIYIFCLDKGREEKSSNPLNLENWTFFVVPTSVINDSFGDQKVLSLNKIKTIERYGEELTYGQIKETVDCIIDLL